MADLNPIEQIVLKSMEELGASSEEKMKTADDIMKKCNRPKGQISNALMSMVSKGVIMRKVREKASGYYLIKK